MAYDNLLGQLKEVQLKDQSGLVINPATEDKQDDEITAINAVTTAIGATPSKTTSSYYYSDKIVDSTNKYFLFINAGGAWYILRMYITTKAARYAKGASNYATAWTNYLTQSYDYADITF